MTTGEPMSASPPAPARSSAAATSVLVCAGCGAMPDAAEPLPFRCARAGTDDADHVVARVLDLARVRYPTKRESNPFVRYRELLHSYHVARAGGMSDAAFVAIVERLDTAIARVDGNGFRVTPFAPCGPLNDALGRTAAAQLWVKDETGNVAGSHKARHLMGVAVWLEVMEQLGRAWPEALGGPSLAIASCGNAALAAAVVARAAQRTLDVYVPADVDPRIVRQLGDLGARLHICHRLAAERGDPCMREFRAAIASGAIPFGCQGSDNGLTIEGGGTLGYEIVSALGDEDVALDRIFVQVGGGALASATMQALREAVALGVLPKVPRFHAVQTRGAHPLARAYERVAMCIDARGGESMMVSASMAERAERVARADPRAVSDALRYARTHRSEFMWPWEEDPASVAHGILDDETYDWFAIVSGMIETGGYPIVVSEDELRASNALARAAGLRACHTGSAGLAGALAAARVPAPAERWGVLLTGVERGQ
jgi:threonine synthase